MEIEVLEIDLGQTMRTRDVDEIKELADHVPHFTVAEAAIIQTIINRGGMAYGLEITDIPRGTVYVTLQRLESRGILTSFKEDSETGRGRGGQVRQYQIVPPWDVRFEVWVQLGRFFKRNIR